MHSVPHAGGLDYLERRRGRDRRQDLTHGLRARAGQGRVGGQNLRAAVGGTRMGVHDAARDLHQLADVSHKKDIGESLANAAINRIAHEVGDDDHRRTV